MWVIQGQHLVRLPDNAPIPSGSVRVDVPDDFSAQPEAYTIENGQIAKRSEKEIQMIRQQREAQKLSQQEIARIKKAIAEGRL